MGFLGKSPESKSTKKTGRTLAILSLATKTWWTGADEQRHEKTEWHRIIVWNGLAEYAADTLKKGDHLYVVGTLVSNVYEKEVGKGKNKAKAQITAWQIKAFSIRKLDRKESAPTAPSTAEAQPGDAPFSSLISQPNRSLVSDQLLSGQSSFQSTIQARAATHSEQEFSFLDDARIATIPACSRIGTLHLSVWLH
jgi:single-strand DNA-binding protein